MGRFTEKQQEITQRAAEVIADYPALWSQMITQWRQPDSDDQAWLMYSANYLFRTANVRWAMDPLRLKHKLSDAPEMSVGDLKDLDFILLTHQHSDHLDLSLLHKLQGFPILWVVPAPLLPMVQAQVEIAADRLIVPEPMQTIEIQGIRITPFDGLHWEIQSDDQPQRGVPAMGYMVEFNGKRWLFPGDTRSFDTGRLSSFSSVDMLFAHVWLGRGCALQNKPYLLDAFCKFCVDLKPAHIVLTHLQDFGRDANDYWDKEHVQQITSIIAEKKLDISISSVLLGDQLVGTPNRLICSN